MTDFKYRGRDPESLTIEDFTKLTTSRIRRTILRGFTHPQIKLLEKCRKYKEKGLFDKMIKTHCRDMPILPEMIGLTIGVYNGKEFVPVKIKPEMLDHYLGEFSPTRKQVQHGGPGVGASRSSKGQARAKK